MSSAANILHATLIAALWLLGVSIALICLRCTLVLPLLASISTNQLFPLGLLLGFSGGSLLAGSLCVLDPIVHFGVLFIGSCVLLYKYRIVVDNPPLTSATMVTFAGAVVQVQFIPVAPFMQVPFCLSHDLLCSIL